MKFYRWDFLLLYVFLIICGFISDWRDNKIEARLNKLESASTVAQQPQERHFVCDTSYVPVDGMPGKYTMNVTCVCQ